MSHRFVPMAPLADVRLENPAKLPSAYDYRRGDQIYALVFTCIYCSHATQRKRPPGSARASEMVSALSTNRIASAYPDVEAYRRIKQVHEVRGKKQTGAWIM